MCPSSVRPAADLNLKISGGHKKGRRSAAWIGRMGWVGLARSAGEKYRVAPRRGREVEGAAGCDWTAGDQKNTFLAPKEREEKRRRRLFQDFPLRNWPRPARYLSLSLPSCPDTYLKASLFCQNISHILDKAVVLLKCLCVAREPSLGNIHPRGR